MITLEEYRGKTRPLGIVPVETDERYGYYETDQRVLTNFINSLYNANLLNNEVKLIDVGCGLSTTLYNFYLQLKEDNRFKFELFGIEGDPIIAEKFEKELLSFFQGNLSFSFNEAEKINYSKYNVVYLYSPMKYEGMCRLYDKIFSEIKPGTIVYDAYLYGKGLNDVIDSRIIKFGLTKIQLEFGGIKHEIHVKK